MTKTLPETRTVVDRMGLIERRWTLTGVAGASRNVATTEVLHGPALAEHERVEVVPADQLERAVSLDDPRLIETLARVIENRHGTLPSIGSTLREALTEFGRER